ncbi:hypothetical protein K7432_009680 [Basidiobolus ranarum]|uniref:F-box domain-containing protein n=1 Tax=Basidiobolus ranarum TaxID=34480 RepID=A0ABR2VWT5_9FUNG
MSLPPEILTQVFSYLESSGQLSSCVSVCSLWYCVASSIIWRSPKPSVRAVKSLTQALLTLQKRRARNNWNILIARVLSNKRKSLFNYPYFTRNYSLLVEEINFSSQKTTQYHIHDSFIQIIARNCPQVRKVDLTNCYKLTDIAVKAISFYCKNVESFSIAGCTSITDSAISTLANCSKLQTLSVKHCFIEGHSLVSVVEGCPKLTSLDLSHCQNISRQSLEKVFETGREFESLQLDFCPVTRSVVQKIALYSNKLRHLNLNNVYILTDCTIIDLASRSSLLAYLSVASSSISDSGILALAQNCKKLKSADVSYCSGVTSRSVLALATQCPEIEQLSMGYCDNISDVGIIAIANSLPDIQNINITYCGQISNSSIKILLDKCRKLKSLKMGYCGRVTREAIQDISNRLPDLRSLDISGMQDLRDDDVRQMFKKLPRLQNLGFKACSNISDELWDEVTSDQD